MSGGNAAASMFVEFACTAQQFTDFMVRCAESGATGRFDAFLRSWHACARLRGDKATWLRTLRAAPLPASGPPKTLFMGWQRQLCDGIREGQYPVVSSGDASDRAADLWTHAETVVNALDGACCVLDSPSRSRVEDVVGAMVLPSNTARVIDRYALSRNKKPTEPDGLTCLLEFLARRGVASVEVASAVSKVGDRRGDLIVEGDAQSVVKEICGRIAKAPRVRLKLYSHSEMCEHAHDRFLAFVSPGAPDSTGASVQIGPGIRSFTGMLTYPITISRVPVKTFAAVWKRLPAVKLIEV